MTKASPAPSTTTTNVRVGRDDLEWWLDFAATREWTFAKTYAETAPHHYVVQDRTLGVSHEDMVRAARVIHTFGQPGKYYSLTKIYLVSRDGRYRWWTEDNHFTDTTLVNRATTELFYGIQNAPTTVSGIDSPYDAVATSWDIDHPPPEGEADRVRALLSQVRGQYPPHVLDLGSGTGRVLDLGLASPDRYAAVDSSQAMLNLLIRKHPRLRPSTRPTSGPHSRPAPLPLVSSIGSSSMPPWNSPPRSAHRSFRSPDSRSSVSTATPGGSTTSQTLPLAGFAPTGRANHECLP